MDPTTKVNHAQITPLAANRSESGGLAGPGRGLAPASAPRSDDGCLPLCVPTTWTDEEGTITPSPPLVLPMYSMGPLSIPHFDTPEDLKRISEQMSSRASGKLTLITLPYED
jgi:hypothetical protein